MDTLLHEINLDLNTVDCTLLESDDITIVADLDAGGWSLQSPYGTPEKGFVMALRDGDNNILAASVIARASESVFKEFSGKQEQDIENTLYIDSLWVSPRVNANHFLNGLLYLTLRRGRLWGCQNVASIIPSPNTGAPIATYLRMERISSVDPKHIAEVDYVAIAQRLNDAIFQAYSQCSDALKATLPHYFVQEILEYHAIRVKRFFKGSWARAIIEEKLSKEQYISSLYNLHQYVKHTTRLCARCIAHSENRELRNHYIYHLKGEINHELLIESDLKTLDADVEYLIHYHVPHHATNEFIVTQESTIGFKEDPVLMLACPLAAEGISASMDKDFIEHLYNNIKKWGIKNPKKASTFLTSHINFDGGEDGHWQQVVNMLKEFINTETLLQQFLCTYTTAINGFERGFNSNVDDLRLWNGK